jgi:hypothetical protein
MRQAGFARRRIARASQAAMASSIAASSSQASSLFGAVSEDKTRLLIGWLV